MLIDRPVAIGEGTEALHGTLALHDDRPAETAVLIWPGSGPTDRDGNIPNATNNSLKLLAHGLAEAGCAALRVDKRGVGESAPAGPAESELRFDMYVEDAVSWADYLRNLPDTRRLFLLGHSEGALVATLAAQRIEADGLIALCGIGFSAADTLRRQLEGPDIALARGLVARAMRIIDALERGETDSDVPDALAAMFRPSVQRYLISWFRHDPADAVAGVTAPALVVQGDNDLQVTMADAERLAAARRGTDLVRIEGMNHVLKDAPRDRAGNFATYARPLLPLSPALLPDLRAFIGP